VDSEAFSIEDRHEGGRHTLLLSGDLDMASAPALDALVGELCAGEAQELVLDLSQLEFVDSSGLGAILRSAALCKEHTCELGLIPGRRWVQRVFELTQVLDRLPFRNPGEVRRAGPASSRRSG
jgi:anti-sigma B factor antagonist